jgi:hypothetical protein
VGVGQAAFGDARECSEELLRTVIVWQDRDSIHSEELTCQINAANTH